MTYCKPDSKEETGEVDDEFENGDAVAVSDCHRADNLGRLWSGKTRSMKA